MPLKKILLAKNLNVIAGIAQTWYLMLDGS